MIYMHCTLYGICFQSLLIPVTVIIYLLGISKRYSRNFVHECLVGILLHFFHKHRWNGEILIRFHCGFKSVWSAKMRFLIFPGSLLWVSFSAFHAVNLVTRMASSPIHLPSYQYPQCSFIFEYMEEENSGNQLTQVYVEHRGYCGGGGVVDYLDHLSYPGLSAF